MRVQPTLTPHLALHRLREPETKPYRAGGSGAWAVCRRSCLQSTAAAPHRCVPGQGRKLSRPACCLLTVPPRTCTSISSCRVLWCLCCPREEVVARGRATSLGPLRSFHPPVLGLAILEGQRGSPAHLALPLLAVTSGLTPFLSSDILVCNGKQGVPFLGVLWGSHNLHCLATAWHIYYT